VPNPGGIIRRGTPAPPAMTRPTVELPFGMKGAQPIFDYLQNTAERTLAVQDALLEALQAIHQDLTAILAQLEESAESKPAPAPPPPEDRVEPQSTEFGG
jgi:hypothetical protein